MGKVLGYAAFFFTFETIKSSVLEADRLEIEKWEMEYAI